MYTGSLTQSLMRTVFLQAITPLSMCLPSDPFTPINDASAPPYY